MDTLVHNKLNYFVHACKYGMKIENLVLKFKAYVLKIFNVGPEMDQCLHTKREVFASRQLIFNVANAL